MSTIRVNGALLSCNGEAVRGYVTALFMPSTPMLEDALELKPESLSAYRVHMPAGLWKAIEQLAEVSKVAEYVNKRVMNMDMQALGEPFATITDVRGAIVNFVYKMGLRVQP